MKKIINYIFLIVICLLPVMVDAKANLEFDTNYKYRFLYHINNKQFYLYNTEKNVSELDGIEVYGQDGKLVEMPPIETGDSVQFILDDDRLFKFYETINFYMGIYSKVEGKKAKVLSLNSDEIISLDLENMIREESFQPISDYLGLAKEILGSKYDCFLKYYDDSNEIIKMDEYEGFCVIYYLNSETNKYYTVIYNDKKEKILSFSSFDSLKYFSYVYDGIIYVVNDNVINIYKSNGDKIDTIELDDSLINFDVSEFEMDCGYLKIFSIFVVDNYLYTVHVYDNNGCELRLNLNDEALYQVRGMAENRYLTTRYKLNYDVEKINSTSGDFTYETKVDEDGESYVELKVVPKDGYSVEEIIVTDINGNRIEVTDNKFSMPMNDVTVEVKYVKGEYLPIPDTFLGKSVSLIIIGLILVGLGSYTINYVKNY